VLLAAYRDGKLVELGVTAARRLDPWPGESESFQTIMNRLSSAEAGQALADPRHTCVPEAPDRLREKGFRWGKWRSPLKVALLIAFVVAPLLTLGGLVKWGFSPPAFPLDVESVLGVKIGDSRDDVERKLKDDLLRSESGNPWREGSPTNAV